MYSINAGSTGRRRTVQRSKSLRGPHMGQLPSTASTSFLTGQSQDGEPLSKVGRSLNFCRVLLHFASRAFGLTSDDDAEYDDFDVQVVHYKPSNLDELCHLTQYSREEIKLIYRGFKQECPSGVVDEETFKELYGQFYPLGDAGPFAGYIFATFDRDEDGHVTFDQFIQGMSTISRGTLQEKARWVFNLYDINGSGKVTKGNLRDVVSAVYQLLGAHAKPSSDEFATKEHVDRMFNKFDLNRNGEITFAEFMQVCETDPRIQRSMALFDTIL
ncbi:hypothetical protein RvY_15665-1 [Ramazzottius varieornatus]|uniref:EF-hand domain-containing protein n=1 Tax=Ramazzottius varieornatus TaxID=947166 RepID=A0A1D1VVR1_RAMVA|nr:hypothetical protein RvY_15665-1 [Ramazzottius varieornatus]